MSRMIYKGKVFNEVFETNESGKKVLKSANLAIVGIFETFEVTSYVEAAKIMQKEIRAINPEIKNTDVTINGNSLTLVGTFELTPSLSQKMATSRVKKFFAGYLNKNN